MKRKAELDRAVAAQTGLPLSVVRPITTALTDQVIQALANDGEVHVDRLGKMTVHTVEGRPMSLVKGTFKKGERGERVVRDVPFKIRVHFQKATSLRVLLAKKARRKSWLDKIKKKK